MAMVARVAMMAFTRPAVTRTPFVSPHRVATITAAAIPAGGKSVWSMARAAATPDTPTMEPTETSMPPDMITIVWAEAIRPRIATALRIFVRLRG